MIGVVVQGSDVALGFGEIAARAGILSVERILLAVSALVFQICCSTGRR